MDESGLRGTVAQRDMKKFQVAVKIKNYMTIPLGEWNKSSEVRLYFLNANDCALVLSEGFQLLVRPLYSRASTANRTV